MSLTDPNRLLDSMGVGRSRRRVQLMIIGEKRRLKLPDGTFTRSVAMLEDTPPFTVHCTDEGFAPPTEAQKQACLEHWITTPNAPRKYIWREGEEPNFNLPDDTSTTQEPIDD